MKMDELLQMGAAMFSKSSLSGDAGSNLDIGSLTSAISGLTGGDGGFDLGALVNNLNTGGLGDLAKSWLGDGGNEGISPEQISSVIGSDKISEFASDMVVTVRTAGRSVSLSGAKRVLACVKKRANGRRDEKILGRKLQ